MAYNIISQADLSGSYISVRGTTLKYMWNDEVRHIRNKRGMRAIVRINPKNLTSIFLMLDGGDVRVEAPLRPSLEKCEMILQNDFWGQLWAKVHRYAKNSKKYNEEQGWITVTGPPFFGPISLKKDCI